MRPVMFTQVNPITFGQFEKAEDQHKAEALSRLTRERRQAALESFEEEAATIVHEATRPKKPAVTDFTHGFIRLARLHERIDETMDTLTSYSIEVATEKKLKGIVRDAAGQLNREMPDHYLEPVISSLRDTKKATIPNTVSQTLIARMVRSLPADQMMEYKQYYFQSKGEE